MLKSKIFMKKTRKGKILKIVREHYLRDDIWSGTPLLPLDLTDVEPCREEKSSLEACPVSRSSLCAYPHYVLPDTNVLLHQVNIFSLFGVSHHSSPPPVVSNRGFNQMYRSL